MRKIWMVLSAVVLAGVCAVPAMGAPIVLNNTGAGVAGGGVDLNWILQTMYPAYVPSGSPLGFPYTSWMANDGTSSWIAPRPAYLQDGTTDDTVGNWVFQTTFDLTGLVPSTAQISGRWMADNQGIDMYLNSTILSNSTPLNTFNTWTLFALPQGSGFISGLNTLTFVVRNDAGVLGNPVGLRVEMSGTANGVPEPATLALLGAGMLCLGMISRRKKRS